jgi:hypothetical protein
MDRASSNSETSAQEREALELLRASETVPLPPIDVSKSVLLDDSTYMAILKRLQSQDLSFVSHRQVDPEDPAVNLSNVVSASAVPTRHFEHKGRNFAVISEHEGNGSVIFKQTNGLLHSGIISQVWRKQIRGSVRTFISLIPHEELTPDDELFNPWPRYPGFRNRLYYAESKAAAMILEPEQLISHAPQRERPEGWYGIKRGTRVVHMDLNRGRR